MADASSFWESTDLGGTEPDDTGSEWRIAGWTAALFFGVFLGGAALVPLDSGAIASGTVVVAGNRQAVQHREGGIVTALPVREGQHVRRGDLLLSLSATEIRASERGLTAELLALYGQRQRLLAERDQAGSLTPPVEFEGLTGDDRLLADEAWAGQTRLFAARRSARDAEKRTLSQRVSQNNEQISGYQRQIAANRDQQKLLSDEISGMKIIAEKGWASKNHIRALERGAAQLEGEYGRSSAEVARLREAIGEISVQTLLVDRTQIEEAATQLRDVMTRIDQVRPQLVAAREALRQTEVRAPATGAVVGLKVFTVGGVVGAGNLLMEIVPDNRELVIQATVSPQDADEVVPGKTAEVRFPSFHERNLPILNGTVSKISADALVDERTGLSYFQSEIRVPPEELAKLGSDRAGKKLAIQAGLPVEVVIPLRKRTALDYLLEPLTKTIWLSGRES